jgi:hypothetical protein
MLVGKNVACAASSAPGFEVDEVRTISWQPDVYHGWPTLTRLRSGRLMVVWSGGREEHVCPFGRVECLTSDDDGVTWTWPRVLLDGAIDDRDAGILETAKGSLLVTTFSSLAYEPTLTQWEQDANADAERTARWQAARDRLTAEQRQRELGTWMIRSTDGGLTWSSRYDCLVNSPHGPIQLSDGSILYAGRELWSDNPRVGVACSHDDGVTWEWLAEIPARDGDNPDDYHELHAIETEDNRIIAQIRNHNPANEGETLQCESSDGGMTWSKPVSIGIWGLPSHLMRMSDDRLLMTYGHRRDPLGNQARLSEDQGRTWSEPMVIYGSGTTGDLGYPSTVQLDDGSLLTVWYEVAPGDAKASLRQAKWRLTD